MRVRLAGSEVRMASATCGFIRLRSNCGVRLVKLIKVEGNGIDRRHNGRRSVCQSVSVNSFGPVVELF